MPVPAVRYHLRAHLTESHLAEELPALRRVLREGTIDEVIVFLPHAEEGSPGLGTEDENRRATERLRPVFAELRAAGVACSINVWWTLGYSEFAGAPRDRRDRFAFRWAVSERGDTSTCVACPRDPRYRQHLERMYATFAELKPRVLWIDDDTRATLRASVRSACFCNACVDAVAQRVGQPLTRETLMAALLADPPSPIREAWMSGLDAMIRELDQGLADAVHSVSLETRIGLMISPIEGHAAEGRDWPALFAAVSPPDTYLRPTLGTYQGGDCLTIALGLGCTRAALAIAGPGVTVAPEVENYPQSRFVKPARMVACQMQLCQALGIAEMTFSIYRFGGRIDLERDRIWERTLGALRPRLQAIAETANGRPRERGIGLFFHPDEARHTHGRTSTAFWDMQIRRPWDVALPLLGFATCIGRAEVTLLTGEQPAALTRDERHELLRGGVFLDARAAATMIALGDGELIGASAVGRPAQASLEVIADAEFGLAGDLINLRYEGAPWQFALNPKSRVISRLRALDGRDAGHGMALYENALGGRVALCPLDGQIAGAIASGTFINWPRQDQLRAVFTWLGRQPPPLFVADAPSVYPILVETGEGWLIAVANLNPDPVERLHLVLPCKPAALGWLDGTAWRPAAFMATADASGCRLDLDISLAYLDVAILRATTA